MFLDFTKQKLLFDFDFTRESGQPFLGGHWHKPETDSEGNHCCWLYGKSWIILPAEFAGRRLLFQLNCRPYTAVANGLLEKISFKNLDSYGESNSIFVDLNNSPKYPRVVLEKGQYEVKAELVNSCVIRISNTDFGQDSIDLEYKPFEECLREFIWIPKLDSQVNGCVMYFIPEEKSVYKEIRGDEVRELAFAFRTLRIASIDESIDFAEKKTCQH